MYICSGDEFYDFFTPKNQEKPEIHGGFSKSHWCGSGACEATIKEDLAVTIRCIPLEEADEDGTCIVFKANPKGFEIISENKLDDGCMASPGVLGDDLLIRTKSDLYRISSAPLEEFDN